MPRMSRLSTSGVRRKGQSSGDTQKAIAAQMRCRGITAVLLLLSVVAGLEVRAASGDGVRTRIAGAIASATLDQSTLAHGGSQALQSVYSGPGNAPLWSREGRGTPQAEALLLELQNAQAYGLEAKDYQGNDIGQLLNGPPSSSGSDDERWARFDVELSVAALHFISDLHYGRVTPEAAGFKLREDRPPFDLAAALESLTSAADVRHALSAAEPAFYHYGLLKDALARLRRLVQQADFAQLPPPPTNLKVGDTYAGAPALRRMLSTIGDLPPGDTTAPADTTFDANLSVGVRNYQLRHGLAIDGLLGKATFTALKTPPAQRIRQITLTLERWRWLSPFKTPPIIVNIPQFRLFAFRTTEDRVADILQMDVIVGRAYPQTQTPVFEGDMRYVILRPYWDVPYSITQHEMLPKIRANPGYLAAQHLEIASGPDDSSPAVPVTPENLAALEAGRLRLRQLPGEDNALGLAKFIFPNNYNVYLHSTPAHNLFKEPVRAFSHGCIRVSDPVALATLVLKDAPGNWTREKIEAAMNGSTTVRIDLARPINVLIVYATALATEAGPVLFFDDIYGYDRRLERQLGLAPVS
jgi:L,D-transpeptidase YcbB